MKLIAKVLLSLLALLLVTREVVASIEEQEDQVLCEFSEDCPDGLVMRL